MPTPGPEPRPAPIEADRAPAARIRSLLLLAAMAASLPAAGCGHSGRAGKKGGHAAEGAGGSPAASRTAGIRVIRPVKRDIKMTVVQPGTIQAFEVTPIYSRISGYVERYRYNIGDRLKKGDVLLDMWIPDIVEQLAQKSAEVKRAEVQIRVAEAYARAAQARLETAIARVTSAEAGVKRAQASYDRWESEYKRLQVLVTQRVLDVQVRDETYRQFEEAAAARDQAMAAVAEARAMHDQAEADLERARVDVEAARADLEVDRAEQRLAQVNVDYGHVKVPYDCVVTERNVSPGDYLQPGLGVNGRPLFVVEEVDPVRIFVGVPELASFFIKDGDTALIRFQAIPGATREGKIVRSGFSLNPTTRTLQAEIDVPNGDGHLHPGWYVTVMITVQRKQVWALPADAIGVVGQNYFVYFEVDGKPVRTPVIVGPSDDQFTEVLKKFPLNGDPNTNAWPEFDGTERVLAGNIEFLTEAEANSRGGTTSNESPGTGANTNPNPDSPTASPAVSKPSAPPAGSKP